jgi:TorA maturation chaperone TorD
MRDPGLTEAINVVGGVDELAQRIGISQPSVSNWARVPADRLAAVEAATGVSRRLLRPDLFAESLTDRQVDPVDAARAQEYTLVAALLARAPDVRLLKGLTQLQGDGTDLGAAHAALAEAAGRVSVQEVEREYFELFIGVGRGELLPYASYYLTGFLHERPLARLREALARLGIERTHATEPEDHAAILCEVMAGFAGGDFKVPQGSDRQFFEAHLAPWIARFFADLERAEAADFYRAVGSLGSRFVVIETEAFALSS